MSHLDSFNKALQGSIPLLVEELWDAPKAALIAEIVKRRGGSVLVVTGGVREGKLYDDLPFFTNCPVLELPAWETLPSEAIAPSPDIVGERFEALWQLSEAKGPVVLLCPLQSCLQRVMAPRYLRSSVRTVQKRDTLPFSPFIAELEALGYERRPVVGDKGEFAVRGGIIDLFPVGALEPFRLEFWGDEVEAIRRFDPVSQRSVGTAEAVRLTPAKEPTPDTSLLSYLPKETVVIFDDLAALEDRYVALTSIPGAISPQFISFEAFLKEVKGHTQVLWTATAVERMGPVEIVDPKTRTLAFTILDQSFKARRWISPFITVEQYFGGATLLSSLSKAVSADLTLEFVADSEDEEHHLKAMLVEAEVPLPAKTSYGRGYLSSGFVLEETGLAVIPTTEFTHRYKVRRQRQRVTHGSAVSEFTQLIVGELVVHLEAGIGRYVGVEKHPNAAGTTTEYLAIEYAEAGKLYVPLTSMHLVSRYIGAKEEAPKLSTLGTGYWARTRRETEKAIRDYAEQLLQMHAERTIAGGFAYTADGDSMRRFEREFPYIETDDQLTAIAAVKADMEAPRPMDRLVCGDVGYGKTEVAMRAAFKAVEGGKQVALLVPTTVLASQHHENFTARLANFPVTVGVLSRFCSAKEIRQTLQGVAEGTVDILIGTHKIIGPDVEFKDLGLVVIDEEQRFGVRVKEKIRSFKAGVDCLTLSATPIPRTLYLSLLGARDLSTINTPPQDRIPTKTIICEEDDVVVKNAILRELARDGQIFAVHNRVETIEKYADHLRTLVPQARLVIGHGQMTADALDEVLHTFRQGRADVLVATTIVENGIDIPNANTLLVDRAEMYGLADLYQLRGRVGRWTRRAYAYFMTPKGRALSEIAQARLDAIEQVGGYGGGMRLAMRDLEIRGAGNILGTEQSGQVSKVGFNLYCRLLKQTVNALQGKAVRSPFEVKVEVPFDARIPEDYIADPNLRMEIYARFGEANTAEELTALADEFRDRFGRFPEPVEWLNALMRVRLFAAELGVISLKIKRFTLVIERKKGKKSETQTVLMKPCKRPMEFEEQIRAALRPAVRP